MRLYWDCVFLDLISAKSWMVVERMFSLILVVMWLVDMRVMRIAVACRQPQIAHSIRWCIVVGLSPLKVVFNVLLKRKLLLSLNSA